MPIPVRFYSVTSEQFEKIRLEIEAAKNKDGKSAEELEGGIYFVSDSAEEEKEKDEKPE